MKIDGRQTGFPHSNANLVLEKRGGNTRGHIKCSEYWAKVEVGRRDLGTGDIQNPWSGATITNMRDWISWRVLFS